MLYLKKKKENSGICLNNKYMWYFTNALCAQSLRIKRFQ